MRFIILFCISFNLYAANPKTHFRAVIGEIPIELRHEDDQSFISTMAFKEMIKFDKCTTPYLNNFWNSFYQNITKKNSFAINGDPPLLYNYELNGKKHTTNNRTVLGIYLSKLSMNANLMVSTVRRVCKK